jgi:hypothetical protein
MREGVIGELVSEIGDCCNSVVVSCYCEKLLAEAEDILVTHRMGIFRR